MTSSPRKVFFAVLVTGVILVALSLASLFSPSLKVASVEDSGAEGMVLIAPTCPVMRVGEEEKCQKPFKTSLTVWQGARQVGVVLSDDAGKFRVNLPAGEYVLKAFETPSRMPSLAPVSFTVLPHQFTTLEVIFDSGIR